MTQTDILFVLNQTEQLAKKILEISKNRDFPLSYDFAYNLDEALDDLENHPPGLVYITSMIILPGSTNRINEDYIKNTVPILNQQALAPASEIIYTARKDNLPVLVNLADPVIEYEFQKLGASTLSNLTHSSQEQYQTIERLLKLNQQKLVPN
ncbi:hypothetical protein GOV12_02250 [Candidatus Pacearchaeota archaeon]|nr:hypothetical protein [Candidatus Pacearchaeota archaeon]